MLSANAAKIIVERLIQAGLWGLPDNCKVVHTVERNSYLLAKKSEYIKITHATGHGQIPSFSGQTDNFDYMVFEPFTPVINFSDEIVREFTGIPVLQHLINIGLFASEKGFKIAFTQQDAREIQQINEAIAISGSGTTTNQKLGSVTVGISGNTDSFSRAVSRQSAPHIGLAGLDVNTHPLLKKLKNLGFFDIPVGQHLIMVKQGANSCLIEKQGTIACTVGGNSGQGTNLGVGIMTGGPNRNGSCNTVVFSSIIGSPQLVVENSATPLNVQIDSRIEEDKRPKFKSMEKYFHTIDAQQGNEVVKQKIAQYQLLNDQVINEPDYWSGNGIRDAYLTAGETDLQGDLSNLSNSEDDLLDEGGYGRVYAVQIGNSRLRGAFAFALKVMPLPRTGRDTILAELQVLQKVHSPWIVAFYGHFEAHNRLHLILELAICSLDKVIQSLPATYALQVLLEVTRGLAVLHSNNIIHRDLKPHNVLIGQDLHARLTDFNVAKIRQSMRTTGQPYTPTRTGNVGTVNYKAPEAFSRNPLTFAADIYSLGLLAYSLAKGEIAYSGDNDDDAAIMGVRLGGREKDELIVELPGNTLPFFRTVIEQGCQQDPNLRWTAQQVQAELQVGNTAHPVRQQELTEVLEQMQDNTPVSYRRFYPNVF